MRLSELLDKYETHFTECYASVPNTYNCVNYDDFLLLTTAAKHFSKVLNDACRLSGKLIGRFLVGDKDFLERIRQKKSSQKRLQAILNSIAREFAMDPTEKSDFEGIVYDFLAKDPARKQRRRDTGAR